MNIKDPIMVNESINVDIIEYDNSSVLFLNSDFPAWIRSSTTGLWIFNYIKEKPSTPEDIIIKTAEWYKLEMDSIKGSIMRFINEMLYNKFFVIIGNGKEIEPIPSIKTKTMDEVGLMELWLEITSQCYGSCKHCYKPVSEIYHFPVKELYRLFMDSKVNSVDDLVISGGEPLLHPDIDDILQGARKASNWQIKLVTSGVDVSPETLEIIIGNVNTIQVSLDGVNKDTNDSIRGDGAFERSIDFLQILHNHPKRNNLKIGIAFTPLPNNYEQIVNLDRLGYSLGLDFIHINHPKKSLNVGENVDWFKKFISEKFFLQCINMFNRLNEKIWSDTKDAKSWKNTRTLDLDQSFLPAYDLFSTMKMKNCGAGITKLTITETGNIYPCSALQVFPETCLGNIRQFKVLDDLIVKARKWNKNVFSVDECEKCFKCYFKYLCGGGCRARGDQLTGSDLMCSVVQSNYHQFFEFIGAEPKFIEGKGDQSEQIRDYWKKCN